MILKLAANQDQRCTKRDRGDVLSSLQNYSECSNLWCFWLSKIKFKMSFHWKLLLDGHIFDFSWKPSIRIYAFGLVLLTPKVAALNIDASLKHLKNHANINFFWINVDSHLGLIDENFSEVKTANRTKKNFQILFGYAELKLK